MKVLLFDFHVTLGEELKRGLQDQGIEVDEVNFTSHGWVLGKKTAAGYGCINPRNWSSLDSKRVISEMPDLKRYDAFAFAYNPMMFRLFKDFGKPIILYIGTRYENPYYNDPGSWNSANTELRGLHEKGLLYASANNLYDCRYFERFTGISCYYIPSVCRHVWNHEWKGGSKFVVARNRAPAIDAHLRDAGVFSLAERYRYEDFLTRKGVVHLPYNCSTISMLEHYAMLVPVYVPDKALLQEWTERGQCLTELSWNRYHKTGTRSVIEPHPNGLPLSDPNGPEIDSWFQFHDYYSAAFNSITTKFQNVAQIPDLLPPCIEERRLHRSWIRDTAKGGWLCAANFLRRAR